MINMYLVSIIDSSEKDVSLLHGILEDYFGRSGTTYVDQVYRSGLEFIQTAANCDIVFIETQLEKLDGFETASIMRKLGSQAQLIFLAGSSELAIRGYEVDALDYLLKPVSYAAVSFALDKALRRLEKSESSAIALKLQNGMATIPSNDITYVEVFDHNLVYHTLGGEYNVRGKLSKVYELLDHDRFILCNRSFLVNLRYVTGIWSDHVTVGNVKITVSKSHRKEIASRFAAFLERK